MVLKRSLAILMSLGLCTTLMAGPFVSQVGAATDTYEYNDTREAAYGPLTASSDVHTLVSYIYTSNDVDYYKLTVSQPCHLRTALDVPPGVDYEVFLYESDNTSYVAYSSAGGDGVDEAIDYTIQEPGTYYIRVNGEWPSDYSQTSPYTLYVRFPKLGDTYEFNDNRASAASALRSGKPISSYVFTENDIDYYAVGISSPSHLSMSLTVPPGVDYEIFLYESDNTSYVAYSSAGGDGVDEAIDYTIQEPGTYYIRVNGEWPSDYSQTLPYTLTATGDGMSLATRLAGENRIDTAVEISRQTFPYGSRWAVLATAYNYPDALAGAVLANAYDAPLLLVDQNETPYAVGSELDRLGVKDVFILGGYGAVSPDAQDDLDDQILVHRLAGANRYGTASLVAAQVKSKSGAPTAAFVATGEGFADALSASPYAAAKGYPILLTESNELSSYTANALKSLGVTKVYLMGGTAAVSSSVESAVKRLGFATTRIQGRDRIATAIAMADTALADGFTMKEPMLATSLNFPDSLAGGVLGARLGSPLLLTKPGELSSATRAFMSEHKAATERVFVLGGPGAVYNNTILDIDDIY